MAEGDGVANQGIRVRLDGTATERDIGALRKWLEREEPLDERVRAGELRIQERPRTDGTGTPMGVGMDIVLVVTGAAASVFFQELLDQVKRAVSAWQANRREVEDGAPPEDRVEPVNLDDR
ncbi:hypothetical protein ADK41_31660 [Streptomyces caelestis]|uniref:Uncharacterized protein n=2 Tax=Streptomyces TaxID=1883 RepID=A0A0M9X698_9ACTN|nr:MULTISPECIES: hypothetical protein [Streptomyces]KOT30764.1 hypothetical protein ADK41_31660 [Streptomyces caelestis]KOV29027.1 hypothetical protein ADK58_10545 [Streptomyces sp. XY152]